MMLYRKEVTFMKQHRIIYQPLVILAVTAAFFTLVFYADNKYQTPPPYGKSGILSLNEQDLERKTPVFLIDGWLLTDGRVTDKPTYIGEFSSLQRGSPWISPHGKARYRLTLRYDGKSQIAAADFPRLSSQYRISLDGVSIAQGSGNGRITFLLTPGDHELVVETLSERGYYSGMYFPPALGTEKTLQKVEHIRNLAYALAFLLPLALAGFTFFLWRTGGSISRWFGLLCCCYALYMFRHFVFLFSMPVTEYWFTVQSLALYGLCFCVVRLMALSSEAGGSRIWRGIKTVLLAAPLVLTILSLLIPVLSWAVFMHSILMDVYCMFTFCAAAFFAVRGLRAKSRESRHTLAGCTVFGMGLLVNLLFSNLFEPIRFFWQFEWCGLWLVLIFGSMMVSRNRRILRENEMLTSHLEELVKKRTEEVTQLLNERKAFFSDMAHDLKAPVFATQSFIRAIRKSGVGVDMELRCYLDQAEAKQQEMARRLQGLSALNALDKMEEEMVRVSVQEMLLEVYAACHGEAEVRSLYFFVGPPVRDVFVLAQPEKLDVLFENLIYNAFRATPPNGIITVSARTGERSVTIMVEDTGCGISREELPLIFRRFYVGANNREIGTGLGLYIVQSIVNEMGGTIEVQSAPGKGTRFLLEFPQDIRSQ